MVRARGRVVQLVVLLLLISSSAEGVNEVEEKAKSLAGEPPPPPLFIKPPFHLPPVRLRIAVEGMIYCRSCKLRNYDRLLDASPLPGAVAELRCNNSLRELIKLNGTTNANGYFLIQAPMRKVTTFGSHKCKVFLMSSPLASCNRHSNLSGGVTGAHLKFVRIIKVGPDQWALFAAGYFEFCPAKTTLCPHLP